MRRKAELPRKTCATCGRPFAWRRKWARDWARVRYCSARCRRSGAARREGGSSAPDATDLEAGARDQ